MRSNSVAPSLQAIFAIDILRVAIWKQSTHRLGQMQADTSRWTTGGQKLAEVVHMWTWLQFLRKLFQRNQRRRQGLCDHPVVVARDSLPRHRMTFPPDEYRDNSSRQVDCRARPEPRKPDRACRR